MVEVEDTRKKCRGCGAVKPFLEFHRNARSKDGHTSRCAKCLCRKQRVYQRTHRASTKARMEKYRLENPHKVWEGEYRTRCRRYELGIVIASFTRVQLVNRWGDCCVYCGGPFEVIDHCLTIAAGGVHTLENVVPACKGCNEEKRQAYDMLAIRQHRARVVEVLGLLASRGVSAAEGLLCGERGATA